MTGNAQSTIRVIEPTPGGQDRQGRLARNLGRRSALNACSEFSDGRCGSNMQCNRENWDKPIDPDLLRMILCPNAS
jgi:hypothetical protein